MADSIPNPEEARGKGQPEPIPDAALPFMGPSAMDPHSYEPDDPEDDDDQDSDEDDADDEPEAPPLPAELAALNRRSFFKEQHGKRRRKHSSHQDKRMCPFCHRRKARHIRPKHWYERVGGLVGIRAYTCRGCRQRHFGLSFWETPHLSARQFGVLVLILLLVIAGIMFVYPIWLHPPTEDGALRTAPQVLAAAHRISMQSP